MSTSKIDPKESLNIAVVVVVVALVAVIRMIQHFFEEY
jgi:hypothetical protein